MKGARNAGFTLLEIMLALSIMAIATVVTYLTFSTVLTAWKRGMALSDSLHHGDFIMDQLDMGLKSAYYPDGLAGGPSPYGFWLEDGGDGERAQDMISWVKVGEALVGEDCPFSGSPHRVMFWVDKDDNGKSAIAIKAWPIRGQADDFDPDKLEPVFLATGVTGFDCQRPDGMIADQINWADDWDQTNRIPSPLKIALYMEPLEEGGDPVEIRKLVQVPVAPLSYPP